MDLFLNICNTPDVLGDTLTMSDISEDRNTRVERMPHEF